MNQHIGVIFDMDGVLVNSNPTHKKAIRIFCEKHGQDLSESFIQNRLYGRTNEEWIPEVFGDITPGKIKALADEKEQLFRDLFVPEKHIVDGLHSFLEHLRERKIKMAVATSAPVENADYILSGLDIKNYFQTVLDSSHVDKGKPHPEVYTKAAQSLELPATSCIVFEDSVSGVKAGLNAGAKVIGVMTTHTADELDGCQMLIHDFHGLTLESLWQVKKRADL